MSMCTFHCAVIDGVFEAGPYESGPVRFPEATLTDADIPRVQARVRQRVLRWFADQGFLDPDDAKDIAQWENGGGFSVDASVRIEADDGRGWSDCSGTVPVPPSSWSAWSNWTHTGYSTACRTTVPRCCSPRWS